MWLKRENRLPFYTLKKYIHCVDERSIIINENKIHALKLLCTKNDDHSVHVNYNKMDLYFVPPNQFHHQQIAIERASNAYTIVCCGISTHFTILLDVDANAKGWQSDTHNTVPLHFLSHCAHHSPFSFEHIQAKLTVWCSLNLSESARQNFSQTQRSIDTVMSYRWILRKWKRKQKQIYQYKHRRNHSICWCYCILCFVNVSSVWALICFAPTLSFV